MSSPFIKQLAANDRRSRDAAVESLKTFLSTSRQFEELELLKLWKGLYYCFWHSDRTLVQQALANELAELCMKVKENNFIPFLKAFWTTMCREWKSIDKLRLDKFYTLLRRFTGIAFKRIRSTSWQDDLMLAYVDLLEDLPLSASNQKMPNGIRYHIADIYVEELAKVVPKDERSEVPIDALLRPFERLILGSPTKAVRLRVMKSVFDDETLIEFGYDPPITAKAQDIHASEEEDSSEEEELQDSDEEDAEFTGFD